MVPGSGFRRWRGERGEWFVAMQGALMLLAVVSPFAVPHSAFATPVRGLGAALLACGLVLGAVALRRLRPSLTTAGSLRPDAMFVTSGPYRFVRHPLYAAQMLVMVGWALALGGSLTLTFALALIVVLDRKASMEERRLSERFPSYGDYQSRTRKLMPFIY